LQVGWSCNKFVFADRAPLAAVSWTTVMSDRIGRARCDVTTVNPLLPRSQHSSRPIDETIDWRVAMSSLLYRLMRTHKKLDEEIRAEMRRRAPDWLRVLRLKKLKLKVKDRLNHGPVRA